MSIILLTCAVVLFFMCSMYIILESDFYKETIKSNVSTLGAVIASNSSAALAFDDPQDAKDVLSALEAEPNVILAALYRNDGTILATYPADTSAAIFPVLKEHHLYWFEGKYLQGIEPVMQKEAQLGKLYIKSDLKVMYAQLRRFAIIGMVLIIIALMIAYVLSHLLQGSIADPILNLEQTARSISEQGDYSVRAEKISNDELGALTDAFNQMLSQIQLQNEEILSFNQKLEQKVIERTSELQHQKDFVETIINASVDLVSVFDTDMKYIMMNKKTIESYDGNGELLGKTLIDVFPQLENSEMHLNLQKALKGEHVYLPRYRSKVIPRWFENYFIPLKDPEDNVYGVLTIGHDITNIVESAEKIEKVNAELMKSNRDLEQFAYVASHDLQEPLRKIQTFAQMLSDHTGDPEQSKKYQEKINQSSGRMKQLIQDMLNFSRISNSEEAFVKTDLNDILVNLIIDFELLLDEKDAVINYPKLPVIPGIPLQLSQLFSNIINNSLKYTKNTPVITITCDRLTTAEVNSYHKLDKNLPYYRIQFIDNGIGFEPQYSEQIFAIFQRLHGKQSYSGTGIGLALCKKIVENHHGIIYAEGQLNEGATFTIIMPGAEHKYS